ncbi:hypothetical protein C2S52_014052 [Perilla frutescens var. hirtella]|nr:hypothetical protein C2S52_014052 [Perilla frutescens var. hirtella]
MELLLSQWFLALVIIATISSFYFVCHAKDRSRKRNDEMKKLPPHADGGWPFIGHLFQLTGPEPLHITLSKMADKYGPIFMVRLGTRHGLVVNSWEAAKECYRINDVAFGNRPRTAAMGLMGYDFAMFGFSNYGDYWREMRKISVVRLLSNRKVSALGESRQLQVRALMRTINNMAAEKATVDMKKMFGNLTLSLMIKTVAGDVEAEMDSRLREKWRRSVRDFFKMMTVFTISDAIPSLKWIDKFGRMHRAFDKTGRDFDEMLQGWLVEHKKTTRTDNDDRKEEDDFMTEMLSEADGVAQEFPLYDADTINKATCLTMMVGGTETTAATLTWALTLLLNNRHTLKRAQDELDIHVGRERQVKESDLEKLVYIRAVIKETMRVQPPIPVNPREAREDCVVAGYHIPAGTRLFVNTWKIQRDSRVWIDPLEFRPERFLTSHMEVDVQGLHFELLPFGGGRRVCPAIPFALHAAELVLATFLQRFSIDTPLGKPVDMTVGFGTTNMKVAPLEVCLKPRLSPQHYE